VPSTLFVVYNLHDLPSLVRCVTNATKGRGHGCSCEHGNEHSSSIKDRNAWAAEQRRCASWFGLWRFVVCICREVFTLRAEAAAGSFVTLVTTGQTERCQNQKCNNVQLLLSSVLSGSVRWSFLSLMKNFSVFWRWKIMVWEFCFYSVLEDADRVIVLDIIYQLGRRNVWLCRRWSIENKNLRY
jgi:hypothetical protein